jgi:hypothetical protein
MDAAKTVGATFNQLPTFVSAEMTTTTNVDLTLAENITIGSGGSGGIVVTGSVTGASNGTYASGDTTSTLSYTTADAFQAGETITIAYTQPTDGLEDSDGGDLASFSGESVTNSISGGSSYLFEWGAENLTAETYSEGTGAVTAASEGTPTYSFVSGQIDNAIQLTAGTWVRIPATQGGNIDYSAGGMQFYYSYESGTPSGSSYIVTSTYASPSEFMLRRSSTSDTLLILYWAGTSYEITTTENLFTTGLKSVVMAWNCAAQTWSLTIGSSNYPVSLSSTDVPSPPTTQYVYFNGLNGTSSNQTVVFDEVKIQ